MQASSNLKTLNPNFWSVRVYRWIMTTWSNRYVFESVKRVTPVVGGSVDFARQWRLTCCHVNHLSIATPNLKKPLKPPKTLTASQGNWCSWMHENPQKASKTLTGSLVVISITCPRYSKSQKHKTLTASRDNWWIWVQKTCMDSLKGELSLLWKCGLTTPPDWRPFKIPVSPKITSRTSAGYLPSPSVNRKAKHTCQICNQFT